MFTTIEKIKPLITIDSYGRGTRITICGIDISHAVNGLNYNSHSSVVKCEDKKLNGNITMEINTVLLMNIIKNLNESDLENAAKILEPYIRKEQP